MLLIAEMSQFTTEIPDFPKLQGYKGKEKKLGFTIYHYEFAKVCKVSYCMPNGATNAQRGGSDSFYEDMLRLANAGDIL
jgi:hypothetical protein